MTYSLAIIACVTLTAHQVLIKTLYIGLIGQHMNIYSDYIDFCIHLVTFHLAPLMKLHSWMRDINISSLETAILDFSTSGLIVSYLHLLCGMPKQKYDSLLFKFCKPDLHIAEDIHSFKIKQIRKIFVTSGFAFAILELWRMIDVIVWSNFVAQPYLGKVTEAHPITPKGYKMVCSEKSGLGGNFTPYEVTVWGWNRDSKHFYFKLLITVTQ